MRIARAVVGDVAGAFNVVAEPVLDAERLAKILDARPMRLPPRAARVAVDLTYRLRLHPTPPGWLDLALNVPLLDAGRAHRELGWQPRRTAEEALLELLAGLRERAGLETPPLARHRRPASHARGAAAASAAARPRTRLSKVIQRGPPKGRELGEPTSGRSRCCALRAAPACRRALGSHGSGRRPLLGARTARRAATGSRWRRSPAGDVFVGTQGGGVFRSTDDGESWTAVNNGLTGTNVRALAINSERRHLRRARSAASSARRTTAAAGCRRATGSRCHS